jgi:hypothetical protein
MQLDHIRGEIERMRLQVHRQRGDIRNDLSRSAPGADARSDRQAMCAERDRLKKEQGPVKGKALGGRS